MSIRKRSWKTKSGDKREAWLVDYYGRDGERHVETFATRRSAVDRNAEILQAIKCGTHTARSKSLTVAEAGEIWIQSAMAEGLERATVAGYRAHLRIHLIPTIGDAKISDITIATIVTTRDRLLNEGRSITLTDKVIASLGQLLSACFARGLVGRNVCREAPKRKRGRAEQKPRLVAGVDIPLPGEITGIISNAGRWRALILVAAFTGLRASELRGLRWADVDLEERLIHVRQRADVYNRIGRPKSATSERAVPIGAMVANSLEGIRSTCPAGELELVFPNLKGKIETLSNIRARGFVPAQIAAGVVTGNGLPKYKFHGLRHFYASWCANSPAAGGLGLTLQEVQARLGHSSLAMTADVYSHLWPRGDDRAELDRAERAILEAS